MDLICAEISFLGAKQPTQKVYSKMPAQSVFQAILCGVEEMPAKTNGHFCPGISSTPHEMSWNRLWAGTLEYTFCVVYIVNP